MIKDLIQDGWSYHDTDSERLALELEAADLTHLEEDVLVQCLHLSNHTIGEHLGDWARARRFAEAACAANPDCESMATAQAHLAVCRHMDGALGSAQQAEVRSIGAAQDPVGAFVVLKSLLATAMAGTGRLDDAELVIGAVNELALGSEEEQTWDRSLAIADNNIASALYDMDDLDPAYNSLMVGCAAASLRLWKRCGTWINEERGLYLLALVSNRLRDYERGVEYAVAALDVIDAHAVEGGEEVDECFIRLAAADAYAGLSDGRRSQVEIARADALATEWSDASLVEEYRLQRLKVIGSS